MRNGRMAVSGIGGGLLPVGRRNARILGASWVRSCPRWLADWDPMLETSARLLRLLSLLQTRPDWSGAELADRLGVSARTIRRDIEGLRDLAYPVHSPRGGAGYP